MSEYYIPRSKTDIVQWLVTYYPKDKSLKHKRKDQLYAIYYSTMDRIANGFFPCGSKN